MIRKSAPLKALTVTSIIAIAGITLSPVNAFAGKSNIVIDGVNLDYSDEHFLDDLIALNADDIQELRVELADAREEVLDAIEEVQEAREEVKNIPGAGFFIKMAFKSAGAATKKSVRNAFSDVYEKLDEAELELNASADEIGTAEVEETGEVITVLRTGLSDIEDAIDQLAAALNG